MGKKEGNEKHFWEGRRQMRRGFLGKKEGNEKHFWDTAASRRRWRAWSSGWFSLGLFLPRRCFHSLAKSWDGMDIPWRGSCSSSLACTAAGLFPGLSPCFPAPGEAAPGRQHRGCVAEFLGCRGSIYFLVGSILGLEAWSCRALGKVLAGWGHSCRAPGAAEVSTSSFSHIIFPHHFPPHKYECSPSAKVHGSN